MPFATAACNFSTSEQTKVLQTRHVLHILTCKCAFRHSARQFFNIRTYQSAPNPSCFAHFDLQMCFSPQPRAIFQHQNVPKWSKHVMFCAFSLPNVLFTTVACIFLTSELRKVLEKCSEHVMFCTFWLPNVFFATAACNFCFLRGAHDSAPAALTGLLFDWPDTRIIEKTQHFATSLTFRARVSSFFQLSDYCIFCRLTWRLYCWAMHLLFNCPYCRKFLFKLPSIIFRFLYTFIHVYMYTRKFTLKDISISCLISDCWCRLGPLFQPFLDWKINKNPPQL